MRRAVGGFAAVLAAMAAWAAGAPMALLRATHDDAAGRPVGWIAGDCGRTLGALAGLARREERAGCATRVAVTREGHAAMTWLLENARDPHVEVEVRLGLLALPFPWDDVGPTLAERRPVIAARARTDDAHRAALLEVLSDVRAPRALRVRALEGMEALPGQLGTVDAWLRAAAIPLLRERAVMALAGVDPAWVPVARGVATARETRTARCRAQADLSASASGPDPAPPVDGADEALAAAAAWLGEVEGPARVARLYDLVAPFGEAPGPACEEGDLAAALAGVPAPGTAWALARALGGVTGVPVRAWVDGAGARWLLVGDGSPRRARRVAVGVPIVEGAPPSGAVEEDPVGVAPTLRGGVAGGPPPAP